jgi:hypothetical protein
MRPIIHARWEIVCNRCGHRQRHRIPAAQRRTAVFTCPDCGPLSIKGTPWITPNGRRRRDRWARTWTRDEHGNGLWMTITGYPSPPV